MHRGILRMVSLILLLVMTILVFNNTVYTHVHVMPDGSLVTHAHPFQKGEDSGQGTGHQHSSSIYFLLDHFQILFFLIALSLTLLRPARNRRFVPDRESAVYPLLIHLRPGRDPPHCM